MSHFAKAIKLHKYSQTSLIRTPKAQHQVSALQRCPYYRGVRKETFDCSPIFSIIDESKPF